MRRIVFVISCLIISSGALLAQKGQKSISAGSLVSFPMDDFHNAGTGYGIEVNGQYGFTNRSSIVAQTAFFAYPSDGKTYHEGLSFITLKGGYRYQFGTSGIYLNGLAGLEVVAPHLTYGPYIAVTVGGGKRFTFKNQNQVDIGIDILTGEVPIEALNIKAAFLLFKK